MGGSEVAKKTARKTAVSKAANTPAAGGARQRPVDVPVLADMLEQLRDELLEIERRDGPNRKTVSALIRIKDLIPLVRSCQESMTRP
jgi:hypothetical protein